MALMNEEFYNQNKELIDNTLSKSVEKRIFWLSTPIHYGSFWKKFLDIKNDKLYSSFSLGSFEEYKEYDKKEKIMIVRKSFKNRERFWGYHWEDFLRNIIHKSYPGIDECRQTIVNYTYPLIDIEIETSRLDVKNYLEKVFNKEFPVFNYKKIMKPYTVVHCDEKWKTNNLLKWADAVGLKWSTGESYLELHRWDRLKDKTYYDLYSGQYCDCSFGEFGDHISILKYEEVVFNNETQTKGENKMRKDTIVFKTDGPIYTRTTGGMQLFLKEENHKEILNKYNFRGQCNLDVIINDAIRDGKRSFIIMGKNNAIVGVLQNTFMDINDVICEVIYDEEAGEFQGASSGSEIMACPFFLKIIDKKDVNTWIKKLTEERKTFNKKILKMKDKIKKKTKNGENKGDSFTVFTIDE